ncbi:hypothetical protein HK101_006607, partial [Irineochytrium annulatum]
GVRGAVASVLTGTDGELLRELDLEGLVGGLLEAAGALEPGRAEEAVRALAGRLATRAKGLIKEIADEEGGGETRKRLRIDE